MHKTIISLFAAFALAGCATAPAGSASKSTAVPAVKPAAPAPAENGLKGKQNWNGLTVVVPRGLFSCDAAVRKLARDCKLCEDKREFNNDGNGFSYEYSDLNGVPYLIELDGSNEKTQIKVRAGQVWQKTEASSRKLMQAILDRLGEAKPVVGEEKGGDSYKSGI
jgi:hypothetical protein